MFDPTFVRLVFGIVVCRCVSGRSMPLQQRCTELCKTFLVHCYVRKLRVDWAIKKQGDRRDGGEEGT